jgi:hypothetical protein
MFISPLSKLDVSLYVIEPENPVVVVSFVGSSLVCSFLILAFNFFFCCLDIPSVLIP